MDRSYYQEELGKSLYELHQVTDKNFKDISGITNDEVSVVQIDEGNMTQTTFPKN